MNRHGISLNPTVEERALLRKLWRADAARAQAERSEAEARSWRTRALQAEAALAALPPALDVSPLAAVLTERHVRAAGFCSESHMEEAQAIVERYYARLTEEQGR